MTSLQAVSLDLSLLIVGAYCLLLISKPSVARAKVAMALFLSIALSYSPLYHSLSNVEYYSLLSLIYLCAFRSVRNKQIKSTLVIMVVFEFLMAMDRFINAGTETWLYDNFEEVTVVIHILIVSSCLKIGAINIHKLLERIASCLRSLQHSYSVSPVI